MKTFATVIILSFSLLYNATEAYPQESQTRPSEAKSLSILRDCTTVSPDALATIQEGQEKQKRIKKLEKQMLETVGWVGGREWGVLSPSRGPRTDRLYTLYKEMTGCDWPLLTEMYINFNYERKDYSHKELQHLESSIVILLAMRGQNSINTLNETIDKAKGKEADRIYLRRRVDEIAALADVKPWSDLPEYKKDQEAACKSNEMTACTALGYLYEREGFRKKSSYLKAKEFYEKACIAGEKLACVGLGRLYDGGNGIEQDSLKAKDLYEKACAASNVACDAVGESYQRGTSIKPNSLKAMEYYGKACDANLAKSCMSLGEYYFQGWGVAQDYSKAKEYYKKACDLGYQNGCDEYKRLNEQRD
ncbi:MAG: sel1 repeat family protein [Proteobacteria bacterium]|nr:sel1 repeat family protein [Pseudomonadota bacterium]